LVASLSVKKSNVVSPVNTSNKKTKVKENINKTEIVQSQECEPDKKIEKKNIETEYVQEIQYIHVPVAKEKNAIFDETQNKNENSVQTCVEDLLLFKETFQSKEEKIIIDAGVALNENIYEKEKIDFHIDEEEDGIFAHLIEEETQDKQRDSSSFTIESVTCSENYKEKDKYSDSFRENDSDDEYTEKNEVDACTESQNVMCDTYVIEIEEDEENVEKTNKIFSAAEWLKVVREHNEHKKEQLEAEIDYNFNMDGFYDDTSPIVEAKPDTVSKQIAKKVFTVALILFLVITFLIYYA